MSGGVQEAMTCVQGCHEDPSIISIGMLVVPSSVVVYGGSMATCTLCGSRDTSLLLFGLGWLAGPGSARREVEVG